MILSSSHNTPNLFPSPFLPFNSCHLCPILSLSLSAHLSSTRSLSLTLLLSIPSSLFFSSSSLPLILSHFLFPVFLLSISISLCVCPPPDILSGFISVSSYIYSVSLLVFIPYPFPPDPLSCSIKKNCYPFPIRLSISPLCHSFSVYLSSSSLLFDLRSSRELFRL